jgi:hypothetical protein
MHCGELPTFRGNVLLADLESESSPSEQGAWNAMSSEGAHVNEDLHYVDSIGF